MNAISFLQRTAEPSKKMTRVSYLLIAILAIITTAVPSQCAQQSSNTPSAANKKSLDDAMKAMFDVHVFQQAEISPDGNRVALGESLPGPRGGRPGDSAVYGAGGCG